MDIKEILEQAKYWEGDFEKLYIVGIKNEGENKKTVYRTSYGMKPYELIGLLEKTQMDIIDQIML